jgi:hypothetical protein
VFCARRHSGGDDKNEDTQPNQFKAIYSHG